jgi:2-keto-4-pentenoate hydratase
VVFSRGVEAEWSFVLSQDVPPVRPGEAYSREQAANCVAHVVPAIEVTASRLAAPAGGLGLFLADGGGNGLVVCGGSELWRSPFDVECAGAPDMAVRTFVNGKEVARGSGKEVLGHPLEALRWLLNDPRRRRLRKGDLVASGAANGMWPLPATQLPAVIDVEFEGWGALHLELNGPGPAAAAANRQCFLPFDVYLQRWARSKGRSWADKPS